MGTESITLKSALLQKDLRMTVYVPDTCTGARLPVLYFLHGRSGNEQLLTWLGMDRLADRLIAAGEIEPMILVCPNLDNSRGINSAARYEERAGKYGTVHKGPYEDVLLSEVIPYVDGHYPSITDRSGRYIGGISSGGYTALHQGLRHSDLFSKIGGHMPAMDLRYADEDECYFADEAMWLKYDPVTIARMASLSSPLHVWLDDGDCDEGRFFLACAVLRDTLKQRGVDAENHVFPGHHSGEYVSANLEKYLKFYGGQK